MGKDVTMAVSETPRDQAYWSGSAGSVPAQPAAKPA